MVALPRLWLPTRPHNPSHPPPTRLSPIDSICDITGGEKTIRKTNSIQVASRISYEMISYIITTLFIQDIWQDCIVPQKKYSALNIST